MSKPHLLNQKIRKMKVLLDLPELTEYLEKVILNSSKAQDFRVFNSLQLINITGIRACEVDLDYWEILPSGKLRLTPSKRNNERIFEISDVTEEWYNAVVINDSSDFTQSYSTLKRGFDTFKEYGSLTVNKKELACHAYRHKYAKTLSGKGYTDEEIQILMGEKWLISAQKYIFSKIYLV